MPLEMLTMPRTQQNLTSLRTTFATILGDRKDDQSDAKIPELLIKLGLPDNSGSPSKRQHLAGAVLKATDEQRIVAVQRVLESIQLPERDRDVLQELLWDDGTSPTIPARQRRDVAKNLERIDLALDRAGFEQVLGTFWQIDDRPFLDFANKTPTLREEVIRHYINDPDWDAVTLFDKLGAYKCTDARFCRFLEALGSSTVMPDEPLQRVFIEAVNSALKPCGIHFYTSIGVDGYLTSTLVAIGGAGQPSPKNLIFGSRIKPDLRLGNTLDNDIEIVNGAEHVLMYDRPIGSSGLLWQDLQAWYAQTQGISDEDAKVALYRRLEGSLPENSPPQALAFSCFFRAFQKDVPNLPALLPEVWFHWDPQTFKERGKEALLRCRMDFLLLMPGGVRVVIEVDGQHHYAVNGKASPKLYAEMMAADRALRLVGCEVYRFGAEELGRAGADKMLIDFYRALFKRYRLPA